MEDYVDETMTLLYKDLEYDEMYCIGDFVDALHPNLGAWFEGKVQRITCISSHSSSYYSPSSSSYSLALDVNASTLSCFLSSQDSSWEESNTRSFPVRNECSVTEIQEKEAKNCRQLNDKSCVTDPEEMNLGEQQQEQSRHGLEMKEGDTKKSCVKIRYYIKFLKDSLSAEGLIPRDLNQIRPPSTTNISFSSVQVESLVLVNYNINEDGKRGYWYDCLITKKDAKRKRLYGKVFVGGEEVSIESPSTTTLATSVASTTSTTSSTSTVHENEQTITSTGRTCIEDQRICFIREVYFIEKNVPRVQRPVFLNEIISRGVDKLRKFISFFHPILSSSRQSIKTTLSLPSLYPLSHFSFAGASFIS